MSTSDGKLAQVLADVAVKMRSDFNASKVVEHRGSKGTVRENYLNGYLKKYLPGNVRAVGSGEVIDVTGSCSKQCDILIVDPSTPPLFGGDEEEYRVVFSECVYGVIEVKSFLNADQLVLACENIRSVKELTKSAFGSDYRGRRYFRGGQTFEHVPTSGVIFGYEGSSLNNLGEALMGWCDGVEPGLRPDSVWILGSGALCWAPVGEKGLLQWATEDAGLRIVRAIPGKDVILPLTLRLASMFTNVFMPPFDMSAYSGETEILKGGNGWAFTE